MGHTRENTGRRKGVVIDKTKLKILTINLLVSDVKVLREERVYKINKGE